MAQFCPGCGTQRASEAPFCTQCGQPFPGEAPAAQPGAAGLAPPPPQPAPAPAYAPPPAYPPQPAAYAPPPAPGTMGYAPPPPAKHSNVWRWVIIVVGVIMIGFGILRMANGFDILTGGSDRGSSSVRVSEAFLVGTWAPIDTMSRVNCATWLRFNPDRTLTDNAANTGTWTLRPHGDGRSSGTLTMTINNTPARSGDLVWSTDNQFVLGNQSWRRTTC